MHTPFKRLCALLLALVLGLSLAACGGASESAASASVSADLGEPPAGVQVLSDGTWMKEESAAIYSGTTGPDRLLDYAVTMAQEPTPVGQNYPHLYAYQIYLPVNEEDGIWYYPTLTYLPTDGKQENTLFFQNSGAVKGVWGGVQVINILDAYDAADLREGGMEGDELREALLLMLLYQRLLEGGIAEENATFTSTPEGAFMYWNETVDGVDCLVQYQLELLGEDAAGQFQVSATELTLPAALLEGEETEEAQVFLELFNATGIARWYVQ